MATLKPRWFVEDGAFPEYEKTRLNELVYTLQDAGCQVHVGKYKPFGAAEYNFFDEEGPVIFHSSINAIRDFQDRQPRSWYPVAWMNLNSLRCQRYYPRLGKYLLQQEYGFYPLHDLPRLKDFLFHTYYKPATVGGSGHVIFVRPDDNEKTFIGTCVHSNRFDDWYKSVESYCPDDCLCVVSSFRKIQREWRLIMDMVEVVSGSLYKVGNSSVLKQGVPDSVADFATEVAWQWSPHPVWTLDVAEVDDKLYVCEIGSVNCAGWYKCDQRAIVSAVNKHAITDYEAYKNVSR